MSAEISLNKQKFNSEIEDIQAAAAAISEDVAVPVPTGNMASLNNMLDSYGSIAQCMTLCRSMADNTAANLKAAAAVIDRTDRNMIK